MTETGALPSYHQLKECDVKPQIPLLLPIGLIGLGLGIAMPGFTAGPSLLVGREEHGGMAGLSGVTAAVTVFVLVHPRFRSVAKVPAAA